MDLKCISMKSYISIIKKCAGIMKNRAATFQCAGVTQPSFRAEPAVLGIQLDLWPDGTLNCNYIVLFLRLVILGVYAVFD